MYGLFPLCKTQFAVTVTVKNEGADPIFIITERIFHF